DANVPAGFKTYGIGVHVGEYTADFKVRRNETYRTTKYGLSFDNQKGTCNGLGKGHVASDNQIHDIGAVGIFNYGSREAWIHDNTIRRTTTWNSPPELNGDQGPWGMSLGGACSDDNEFSGNQIFDSGGIGIFWNGATESVHCTTQGCD